MQNHVTITVEFTVETEQHGWFREQTTDQATDKVATGYPVKSANAHKESSRNIV